VFDEAKSSVMSLHKIAKPLQLFAVLPILTANIVPTSPNFILDNSVKSDSVVIVSSSEENGLLDSYLLDNKQVEKEEKAKKIDQYFEDRDLPLAGYGKKFVEEAEKNNIPWNLLPSIAMVESTGYKNACKKPAGKNNGFGWGSCKIAFESIDEAIEVVARNIGGNNPKTQIYYKDKSVEEILTKYNPPHIRPDYISLVNKIMKNIENQEI
jgi:hypothetical protein